MEIIKQGGVVLKDINILILSAGRRVELVNCFKKSKERLNINGNIVTCDFSETAPATFFADKNYKICRIDDENYVNEIIEICNKEKIDAIIPTIDTELYKLSVNKSYIEKETKAKVIVSDIDVVSICRDKYKTYDFFVDNKFKAPKIIYKKDIENKNYEFPLFIKPLNGSSSINTFKINNEKELKFFVEYVPQPIIQEFVEGQEFTIDAFVDFEGNPITIVPRKRLAVRSGEILKGIIEKDREIIETIKEMIKVLKPIGHITIQCIKTNEGLYFIEINPRFGGGAPMSIKAGADSTENIYRLLLNEKISYNEDYKDQILSSRYDWAVFISKNGELIND